MKPFEEIVPANDEHDVVDLLIAAHAISRDDVTRHFIELALLHEGHKISRTLPPGYLHDKLHGTGT